MEGEISDFFVVIFKERKKFKWKTENQRIMWFVACHKERENKIKQNRCHVNCPNSGLTRERKKERKKERIMWFVARCIEREKKKQTRSQVSSPKSGLNWESENEKKKKKEQITWFVAW